MILQLPKSSAWYCLAMIAVIILVIAALPENLEKLFEYQHDAIANFELWRLLTGHWVHMGPVHTSSNMLGLWLIGLLFVSRHSDCRGCLMGLLTMQIGVSLMLFFLSPEVGWYRGMSGVLYGFIVWPLLKELPYYPKTSGIMLAILVIKMVGEIIFGPLPGEETVLSGKIVLESHLYGGICGLIWFLIEKWMLDRGRRQPEKVASEP